MSVCALGDGDFTVTHSNSYIDAPVGDGNWRIIHWIIHSVNPSQIIDLFKKKKLGQTSLKGFLNQSTYPMRPQERICEWQWTDVTDDGRLHHKNNMTNVVATSGLDSHIHTK